METVEEKPDSNEQEQKPRARELFGLKAALSVRIWEYLGPEQKLRDLDWGGDEAPDELTRTVVREAQGRVSEVAGNTLVAEFENPFNALSAAKSMQVRLLALQRNPPSAQIVAAAVVSGYSAENASPNLKTGNLGSALVDTNAAQILASEDIYEAAKNIPGFQFSAKAAREAGEGSEALYELLWTDESTYSHVRKAGQNAAVSVSTTNRYQIQSELGRGAMGVVYKAYDQVIGRTVALKTISIHPNFADADELVGRLKQEAKAAGGLDHPNVITIYDVGQQGDFLYLSMQFVEGITLASMLDQGKVPDVATLLSYADQMCSAVGFAHQRGVIHRDLKPANFMLAAEGTIKVLDFGIAKLGDASMTQTGVIVGTPTYMAPEQATGKKLDQRSDIFSLGTVFYELFTREKPFKGDIPAVLYKMVHEDPAPPSVINPSLPNGVDAIIRKALQKNPKDRYQSCEEMRDAFRQQSALLTAVAAETQRARERATASPAEQRLPSSPQYLLTEIDPPRAARRVWVGILAIFLIAAATVGAWAFRVKSHTGKLPPVLSRILGAMRLKDKAASLDKAVDAGTIKEKPSTENAATDLNAKPPAAPADSATTLPADTITPGAKQEPSISTSQKAELGQPGAEVSTTATPEPASAHAPGDPPDSTTSKSPEDHAAGSKPLAESSTAASDGVEAKALKSIPAKGVKRAKDASAAALGDDVRVEGFGRSEIPDLLRKADAAAGAGDYSIARYEYNIVLRLDHRNAAARNGLAHVLAANEEKPRH